MIPNLLRCQRFLLFIAHYAVYGGTHCWINLFILVNYSMATHIKNSLNHHILTFFFILYLFMPSIYFRYKRYYIVLYVLIISSKKHFSSDFLWWQAKNKWRGYNSIYQPQIFPVFTAPGLYSLYIVIVVCWDNLFACVKSNLKIWW